MKPKIKNFGITIIALIYSVYSYKIYPKIKDVRGATRFKYILKLIIRRNFDKIEEEEDLIEDFDCENIIILDGCRYDIFSDLVPEANHIISPGSCSKDFIKSTFGDNCEFNDVVCISANPYFKPELFRKLTNKKPEDVFYKVYPTYERWNDDLDTVTPSEVISDVRRAQNEHPNKDKLIFLMQPHCPFIGQEPIGNGCKHILDSEISRGIVNDVWDKRLARQISHETVVRRYKNNVELALEACNEIHDILNGETIVTSDHGNLLGENGLYGHKVHIKTDELRKVPFYRIGQ